MKRKHETSMWTLFFGLLLLVAPAAVKAQSGSGDGFDYTINPGNTNTITITNYTGQGGAVTIPTNINGLTVTTIGSNAFSYNYSLTSVTIPDSVTSLEYEAFFECTNLANVTISGSVTNIGEWAFFYCISLPSVTMSNGLTSIGYEAFGACGLTNATIPASATNIGGGAFDSCIYLTSVTVPGSFGGSEFASVFLLPTTNVTIANGATSIASKLFYDCVIRSVTIPASVTNIGSNAFGECFYLTSVTMADGLASIGPDAFSSCIYLTNLTIPASVTNLGSNALYCDQLTSVLFAGNAPAYGPSLFYGSNTTVYYLPGTTGWSNTFAGVPAVLWNPLIQTSGASFGVSNDQFGFTITNGSTANIPIVVEASTNLAGPGWTPLTNVILTNSFYFSDPKWTNYPARFYGLGFP